MQKQSVNNSGLKQALLIAFALLIVHPATAVSPNSSGAKLAVDAKKQIGVTVSYDPAYRQLDFPRGDVPPETGVCTDVIVRAYRLQNIDLQQLLNHDMKANWSAYPNNWGLKTTDKNIDHRRVPNLEAFFERQGMSCRGVCPMVIYRILALSQIKPLLMVRR